MKRFALILASVLCCLLLAADQAAMAGETWTRVRSKNFLLVGQRSAGEMRQVAARLEQFREVLAHLFTPGHIATPASTTVIVFKNNSSYAPFKPLYQGKASEIAGYFQSGRDVNYITLVAAGRGENPYGTIFHEYVHLMIDNNMRGAPTWFNEGAAEYYSAFEVTDGGRRVILGKAIEHHLRLLRSQPLLPLRTVLMVDHDSPYYNERDKKSMFYAESWALVHYMMHAQGGERHGQFTRYIDLLRAGAPVEQAFRQAFQTSFEAIEGELIEYIRHFNAPLKTVSFDRKLEFDGQTESEPVSEAEAHYYLGDLLLHTNRLDEAEAHLKQALALDSHLALAEASLGMLRVRQRRFAEARQHLERATAARPESPLTHYYYAFALSREGMDEDRLVLGYSREAASTMREELQKTIELAPGFVESYRLLAFVNLAMNERLDESVRLLRQALTLSPGQYELINVLAQVYIRQENFKAAREVLEPFSSGSNDTQIRERARALLDTITALEVRAPSAPSLENDLRAAATALRSDSPPDDTPRPAHSVLRKRFEGERVRGLLTRIDCAETGVAVLVKVDDRVLKLHSDQLRRIIFLSYVPWIKGELTCGQRNPASTAIVTYRPAKNAGANFDGEAVAVEFIPDEELDVEQ